MANLDEKADRIIQQAEELFAKSKTWADFSNALFAEDGIVAQAFPKMTERREFFKSKQHKALDRMMLKLMEKVGVEKGSVPEKSGKFVVRVPKSVHASLEVEAKEEGVSLNQLASTKLSIRLKKSLNKDMSALVEAFSRIHDGWSSDRVVVDPALNPKFLEACRSLGVEGSDFELNHRLLNLRKSAPGALPRATKSEPIKDYDDFVYASEIAFRHLQRADNVSLDHVLCDPAYRERFDAIARKLCKGVNPYKLRMGALYLRKMHLLKKIEPENNASLKFDLHVAGSAKDIKVKDLPELPGLYAFYFDKRPIFAGVTDQLRQRIERHLQASGQLFLPNWLELGFEKDLKLWHFVQPTLGTNQQLSWLNQFINREKPPLNYQKAA